MRMKGIFIGSFALLILVAGLFFAFNGKNVKELNSITFSNTMTWDAELLLEAQSPSVFTEAQLRTIELGEAPVNDSAVTKEDLRMLHEYVALRTQDKRAEIERERALETSVFGTDTYETFINTDIRPYTTALIDKTTELITPVIMEEKYKYDRVRPSFLDPTLTITIPIPLHPAYPSGHATQAHLFALILGKLNPRGAESYILSAERIAKNREIAGLHYPTDSAAGILLASHIFPLLFENKEFLELFAEAETEWQ